MVYKFLNICVGNVGYATSKNIENPVICFKVEKSWIQENHIDLASITLNRYSDKKWSQYPAALSGRADEFLYFTAEAPGFSSFTITGKAKNTEEENDTSIMLESRTRAVNENGTGSKIPEAQQENNLKSRNNLDYSVSLTTSASTNLDNSFS